MNPLPAKLGLLMTLVCRKKKGMSVDWALQCCTWEVNMSNEEASLNTVEYLDGSTLILGCTQLHQLGVRVCTVAAVRC